MKIVGAMPRGALRWGKRSAWVLVVVAFLVVQATTLFAAMTVGALNVAVASAITAVTGIQTVTGSMQKKLRTANAEKRTLGDRVEDLSRDRTRRQHEKHRLSSRLGTLLGTNAALIAAQHQVLNRVAISARRGIAWTPAKAVPVAGSVVVFGMAGYELANSCAIVNELEAPPGDGEDPYGLKRFCRDNRVELENLEAALEPLLVPLDGPVERAWEEASNLLSYARQASRQLDGWEEARLDAETTWRLCTHHDWMTGLLPLCRTASR